MGGKLQMVWFWCFASAVALWLGASVGMGQEFDVEAELPRMRGAGDDYNPERVLAASPEGFRDVLRALFPKPEDGEEAISLDDVGRLLGLLSAAKWEDREGAMKTLMQLGPDARAPLERLMGEVEQAGPELHLRMEVIEGTWGYMETDMRNSGLARYRDAVEILLFQLRDEERNRVLAAELGQALRRPRIRVFERAVYKACVQHLARRSWPGLLEPITEALPEIAEASALDLVDWIGGASRGNQLRGPVLAALSDERKRVRMVALWELPGRPDAAAREALDAVLGARRKLADEAEQLEIDAVRWSLLGDASALRGLVGRLDGQRAAEDVRILDAIGEGEMVPAEEAARVLAAVRPLLDFEREAWLRRLACSCVGRVPGEASGALLEKLTEDSDEVVRKRAVHLLKKRLKRR